MCKERGDASISSSVNLYQCLGGVPRTRTALGQHVANGKRHSDF